jgi:hypothetical protein
MRGREGFGMGMKQALGGDAGYTKRYKEARYSLEVIGLVGGVGVEVLRHGGDCPLMHLLNRAPKAVSKAASNHGTEE